MGDEMRSYFEFLDIDAAEAQGLFDLLDADLSGDVSIEEFVNGCLRLKGEATAVDVVTLIHEQKKSAMRLNAIKEATDAGLTGLTLRLDSLCTKFEDVHAQVSSGFDQLGRLDKQLQNYAEIAAMNSRSFL